MPVPEVVHVKVRAYASLKEHLPASSIGESVDVILGGDASLRALLEDLRIPREQVKLCYVNGLHRDLDYVLSEGDEVAIFPPIGGGEPR